MTCRSETSAISTLKMVNLFHFNLFHSLNNTELTDTVIFVNDGISHSKYRHTPNVVIATVTVVDYQFCYPTGFLSYGSYAFPLHKLGVHFHYVMLKCWTLLVGLYLFTYYALRYYTALRNLYSYLGIILVFWRTSPILPNDYPKRY